MNKTESLNEYPSFQEDKDKLEKKSSLNAREYQIYYNILILVKHKYEINV